MRVLVFGDSITQGFWDTEGGWAGRLRKYYDARQLKDLAHDNEPTIFNLGISGDVTAGVLKRFDGEVAARKWRWPAEEFTFVFAIGINDSANFDGDISDANKYKAELSELIIKAKKISNRVICVGLTPVAESIVNSRAGKSKIIMNERIKKFDATMHSVCSKNDIAYVPIFDEFKKHLDAGEEILADGLHPNNQGHEIIFDLVKPELDKLIS